jgi:hypothetical protein
MRGVRRLLIVLLAVALAGVLASSALAAVRVNRIFPSRIRTR